MFEQGLAYLLKKFLGTFVEDGDAIKEKVQVGVWSGLIVLENLRLKNSLLSLIDVPISLAYGFIGRLEVRIPWGNLGVDPVMIIVDKIYLLIEPKYEWNPGAADRREQAMKQAKLAATELFANKRLSAAQGGQSFGDYARNWLITSFINKIVDNVQITVREVHVRYEDELSCPSNFCVGITLESLHIQS
ncbi:N-terminal region of Chorein, a TM vesicle-mediated sorter-domain-containing protein, partial [Ochromonadaceae sp. CCMP2298]